MVRAACCATLAAALLTASPAWADLPRAKKQNRRGF